MVLFNYSTKELTAKVVYYGPGLCGKTTNLQYIHANLPSTVKGKMLSLATKTDRTLFFDFLPLDLGEIRGMKTRIQLYTVPGQVFYNETRKLVLKGADGIVFVADSQEQMMGANVESFRNLEENLKAHGLNLGEMPHVIQFNKRDLPRIAGIEEMNAAVNKFNAPFYESVATTGIGVQDTLKAITKLVLLHLTKKYDPKGAAAVAAATPARSTAVQVPLAAPRPADVAVPVAKAPSSAPGSAERPAARAGSAGIPISSIELPDEPAPAAPPQARRTPPPPPDFHGRGKDADDEPIPTFGEDEIDDLVGEVEDAGDDLPLPTPVEEPGEPTVVAASSPFQPADDDAATVVAPSFDDLALPDEPADIGDHPPISEWLPEEPDEVGEPEAGDVVSAAEEDVAPEGDEIPELELPPLPDDAQEPAPTAWAARGSSPESPGFEIDRGFDPEFGTSTRAGRSDEAAAPPPAPPAAARAHEPVEEPVEPLSEEPDDAPVLLTEVADDRSLFADPNLEVARMSPGEAREIVVPVELRDGAAVRRFKLSVTLRLTPVD